MTDATTAKKENTAPKQSGANQKTLIYYASSFTIFLFLFSQYVNEGVFMPLAKALDTYHIKYAFLAATIALGFAYLINQKKIFKDRVFFDETKNFAIVILGLLVITLYKQARNGFLAYSYKELGFFVWPLLFIFIIVNCDISNITRILDNAVFYVLAIFFLGYYNKLTPENFLSISFVDSYSPFENGMSFICSCLMLYYLIRYDKREIKSFLCLVITILMFKRFVFIKVLLIYIFVPMMKKRKVPQWLFWLTVVGFCAMPYFLEYLYSPDFARIFFQRYGITMNEATLDRYNRTVYVINNADKLNHGYGSVTNFLTHNNGRGEYANRSLHCDILKVFIDCSIVGTVLFTYFNFAAVKKNIFSYILMLNIFTEMLVNHPIGSGTVPLWMLVYLILVYFSSKDKVTTFYRANTAAKVKFNIHF